MNTQDENVDQYFGHHGSAYFDEHGPDEDRHHCRGCYVDDVACTGCEHYPPHDHEDITDEAESRKFYSL